MKVNFKRTLITDNKKEFHIGDDIAFKIFNTETKYMDFYIGKIQDILEDRLILTNVETNRSKHSMKTIEVKYEVILANSCNYVAQS